MKAEELRVGNLIYSTMYLKYFIVDVDLDFFYDLLKESISIKNFAPIPFTNEWLEKFGLIHELSIYDDYWYLLGSDWFGIEFDEESNNWFCILLSGKRSIAEFKYVHQLQNLYHALTGEEL